MKHKFKLLATLIVVMSLMGCSTTSKGDLSTQTDSDTCSAYNKEEDITDISENSDNADTQIGLDDYYLEKFYVFFDSIAAGPTGKLWLQGYRADDEQRNDKVYIATDKTLNILYILDSNDYGPRSKIYDKISVVFDEKQRKNIVLDDAGNDITREYADIDSGEIFVELTEDITGVTLWTIQNEDTYDKQITTLYAKDDSGNIKQSWSSDEFDLQFNELIRSNGTWTSRLSFVGRGVYQFGDSVVNLLGGNAFCYPRSGNSYGAIGTDDEGFIYTYHNSGTVDEISKYSDLGEKIWGIGLYRKSRSSGNYSDGLIYVRGKINDGGYLNGFLDTDGNYVLELPLEATNRPIFKNGYAVVECANSGGVKFITLVDKQGNMLFEPIRGFYVGTVMIASEERYLIDVDGEKMILNLDGSTSSVPQIWNSSCVYFDEKYYVVEDGKIIQYDTSSWDI